MAIPVAAALKVVLGARLQARDTDTDTDTDAHPDADEELSPRGARLNPFNAGPRTFRTVRRRGHAALIHEEES